MGSRKPDPKTGKKSGKQTEMVSPVNGARTPTGAHAKNTGGKKGRSGRKPYAFHVLARSILESPKTQRELRIAAQDRETPGYGSLIRTLANFAESKEGMASLETVNRYLELVALAISKHVDDPEVLAAIESDVRAVPVLPR